MVCSWPKWSQWAVIRKVFIMSQWAIEEKRGKTRTSDWFVTWDEFFFFRPITHQSIRKPKPSRITFDIWTKITRCLFLYLNGVGKYWYEFVRLSTLQTANRISISEDFLPPFFSTSTSSSSKNFPKCTHLKGFYCSFLRNLKLFFTVRIAERYVT